MKHHATSTRTFAEDGDPRIIATKKMNVLLDPLKGHLLIKDSGVYNTPLSHLV